MRELAIMLGVMPEKNRPRTRQALVELLAGAGKTNEIVAASMPGYEKKMARRSNDIDKAKWEILEHTLRARFYEIKSCRDYLADQADGFAFKLSVVGDCPVEAEYAAKLEAGEFEYPAPRFSRR